MLEAVSTETNDCQQRVILSMIVWIAPSWRFGGYGSMEVGAARQVTAHPNLHTKPNPTVITSRCLRLLFNEVAEALESLTFNSETRTKFLLEEVVGVGWLGLMAQRLPRCLATSGCLPGRVRSTGWCSGCVSWRW